MPGDRPGRQPVVAAVPRRTLGLGLGPGPRRTRHRAAVLSFAHMKVLRDRPGQRSRRNAPARARAIVTSPNRPSAAQPASPPATTHPTPRQLVRNHLLPLALYLLITVVTTYPLILHFGTHLPGDGRDAWQNYWDYWWLRTALGEGHNPYQTPLLYAPYGVPLYLH